MYEIGANLMSLPARDPTPSIPTKDSNWYIEVVAQARLGNILAFDTLFEYYNSRICTYLAHIVGDNEEGRDLAQETFLKAWQGIGSLHDEARFDTWLYRIATRTAIDHLRRRKFRWSHWETNKFENTSSGLYISGPEEQIAEQEHIRQALAEVSLKYRTCLLLQLVVDFSQRQIAASLNISEKSVSIYVSRGSEQFRQAYQLLSQTNEQIVKERDKTRDKIESNALFRLGAEAFG
jgi:RNA polymerase sigma-70 factor (ECF subfamily)